MWEDGRHALLTPIACMTQVTSASHWFYTFQVSRCKHSWIHGNISLPHMHSLIVGVAYFCKSAVTVPMIAKTCSVWSYGQVPQ